MTDQNGTQHNYTLDNLGRQVSDTAAVLGTGVYGGTGNPASPATLPCGGLTRPTTCWATLTLRPATAARAAAPRTSSIRFPMRTTALAF